MGILFFIDSLRTSIDYLTVAELIALGLREKEGSRIYLPTQIFTGFLYIGAALCMGVISFRKTRTAG